MALLWQITASSEFGSYRGSSSQTQATAPWWSIVTNGRGHVSVRQNGSRGLGVARRMGEAPDRIDQEFLPTKGNRPGNADPLRDRAVPIERRPTAGNRTLNASECARESVGSGIAVVGEISVTGIPAIRLWKGKASMFLRQPIPRHGIPLIMSKCSEFFWGERQVRVYNLDRDDAARGGPLRQKVSRVQIGGSV